MDDLLKSVRNETAAITLQQDLTTLLARGRFRLSKWNSSSCRDQSQIPNQEVASPSVNLDLDKLPIERSSGLTWNTDTYSFQFSVSPRQSPSPKRGVLSQVSSVFDPLGVLAPFLSPSKYLIQDLWRKKRDCEKHWPHKDSGGRIRAKEDTLERCNHNPAETFPDTVLILKTLRASHYLDMPFHSECKISHRESRERTFIS